MKKIFDLIIIGGGPAGVTAGIYAARKRLETLLLSKDFLGQVGKTKEIENYPGFYKISGKDLMEKFIAQLRKFEIKIKENEKVVKVEKIYSSDEKPFSFFLVKTESGKEFLTRAVIVATGRDPRPLEVPGEKEFIARGVSYCSICDAPFFKNKAVAVIGGGNAGFEAALDLAKYAKKIFIFERGEKIRADEITQERVKREKKIELYLNIEIKKIEGRDKVQALIYQERKTKKTYQLPIDGVFIQIGTVPATGFLKGLVAVNAQDEIKINRDSYQTSCEGIFAAGDVTDTPWKQIIIACAQGAEAALGAYEYLKK